MQHGHLIEGHALRLRPLADADAGFVLALRGNPQLNRWLHRGAADEAAQRAWQQAYYRREGDWCFVAERRADARAEGMVALYDFDPAARSAEWGRWVMQPGTRHAVECAWLVLRFAFDELKLDAVFCNTVAANEAVVSFHDSCGVPREHGYAGTVELHGRQEALVQHRLQAADWPAVDARLGALAARLARVGGATRSPAHAA